MYKKEDIIRYFAAENKVKFGSINSNAVLGRVLGRLKKEEKKDIESIKRDVEQVCSEIDLMDIEDVKKIIGEFKDGMNFSDKKKKVVKGLKELPNAVKGKVVTRTAPSPSGYLHIGHVFNIILNYEYAKKYKGRFVLRLEDTNPGNIDKEAYEKIPEDVEWLVNDKVKVVVQSDRMELYYKYMEDLFRRGKAYVCKCKPEEFRKYVGNNEKCPHRDASVEENLKEWENMMDYYEEGEAVVRLRTDLEHPNPAVRDFPIFRINRKEHPLQGRKYNVWPLMNFSVAIDDHELGITHVIRGKDHIINTERQKYIYDYFGWKHPEFIHLGRINFTDFKISKSETKKKIDEGVYRSWDDPRLPFLVAFKRRGFKAESFRKYVLDVGISERDRKTTYKEFVKKLEYFNRQIIDPVSNRYFFVEDPVLIDVPMEDKDVELPLHPDFDRGKRILRFRGKVYISRKDYRKFKGKTVRLKNFVTIGLEEEIKVKGDEKADIVLWVPEESVEGEIFMDDGSVLKGRFEKNIVNESVDNTVQLEKMFFARIDYIEKDNIYKGVKLYYTHR